MVQDIIVGQDNKTITVSYGYNDFGNITSVTTMAGNYPLRINSVTYDSKGRFPLTRTNPLLWVEDFEYDHRTGQVTKHTDANEQVTKYKYDGFGRNVVTEYADGTNRVASLQWDAGSGPDNASWYAQSQTTGSAPAKTWYDRLGREILNQAVAFDGQLVDVETQYDGLGRLWKVSEPFFHTASPTQFTVYDYDPLGRNYQTTLPTGVKLKTDYSQIGSNIITTYKTDDTQTWEQVAQTMNGYGQPVTIADDGGTLAYTYNSMGLPKSITTNGATVIMEYDIHGNRTLIDDPDAGEITTLYNAYDELTSQTDADAHTYTMTYDKLGRITARTGAETTTWAYSSTPGHLGELTSVTASNGTAQSYSYDALGRVTLQTETVSGQEFTKSYAYDSYGRVQTENWNTGFGIMYQYNQNGYLSHVKTQNDQLIWQGQAYNARGRVTDYLLGDDYRTTKSWDDYGFQEQILTQTTGTTPQDRQKEGYNFDELKGNLLSRINHWPYDKTESFYYDNLNRLTNENVSGGTQLSTGFALNGNITQKSDIGAYTYGEAGHHAVTGLTNTTGTLLPTFDQAVDYTDFNKASFISQGEYSYYITYGPDRHRSKTVLNHTPLENTILTKYYAFGDYEKEITPTETRHLHYIAGGDGLAAIYVKNDNAPDEMYFILKDHLGSIVGAINDETGTVYRQNFDAWGRRRNPVDWSYSNIPDFPFDRGYTGHEHLKWFGLINMNGRMYDAAICRFLSPDPYVQMPDYSQSFNRYSYCLNNPLVYTDPSGELFLIDDWIVGFFKGFFSVGGGFDNKITKGWQGANHHVENSARIWSGLFIPDPNLEWYQQIGQVLSRFTWEFPQTSIGFLTAHGANMFTDVNWVKHEYGATILQHNGSGKEDEWGGFTLGNYIQGDYRIEAEADNPLFQHEYGHYLQSMASGWGYFPRFAIPSVLSENSITHPHHNNPVEQDANARGLKYFYKKYQSNFKWDFKENPIGKNGTYWSMDDVQNNPEFQELLNSLTLKPNWYDYASWSLGIPGIVFLGWRNSIYYNSKY